MTITEKKTNFIGGLVSLYHILINEDGVIDERERRIGELMKKHEEIEEWQFKYYLSKIEYLKKEEIIRECVKYLMKCDYELQVKCIAWMSIIANSDGFMAPEEWKLIYRIYNTELKLNLSDILDMQKKLPKFV